MKQFFVYVKKHKVLRAVSIKSILVFIANMVHVALTVAIILLVMLALIFIMVGDTESAATIYECLRYLTSPN